MSDKKDYTISPSLSRQLGIPPTAAYAAAPPVVSYGQIGAAPPPSYVESLSHPVVPSPPQYPPQYSTATAAAAAASAQQLQMNVAAAQQAQKVAYAQQQAFQQYPVYMQQQAAAAAAYAQQVPGYYAAHPHATAAGLQPGQNVVVMNGFDAGARFDGLSQASIPPAPPGMTPNAAQMAAAAGAQVSATQKKGTFLSGGSGGGYTFW